MNSVSERGNQGNDLIDAARLRLIEQESKAEAFENIFNYSVEMLKLKGKLIKGRIFNHRRIEHNINSEGQSIKIIIQGGANVDKINSVDIEVEGSDKLWVLRRGAEDKTRYEGKIKYRRNWGNGFEPMRYIAQNEQAQEFLSVVQEVSKELGITPHQTQNQQAE